MKFEIFVVDMIEWLVMVDKVMNFEKKVKIVLVGKYVELFDVYFLVVEVFKYLGYVNDVVIDLKWVNVVEVIEDNIKEFVGDVDGIIVFGGFG